MRIVTACTVIALAAGAVFIPRPGSFGGLDDRTFDLLGDWVHGGAPSGRLAVVEIDESSLQRHGRWPWPRDLLGSLVTHLSNQGAAVVVFDLMFPEEDREHDAAFVSALRGAPVALGYSLRFETEHKQTRECAPPALPVVVAGPNGAEERWFHRASGAVCSADAISHAAAANGFLNAAPDSDGNLRRVPLVIEYDGRYLPGLALAAFILDRKPSTIRLAADWSGARSLRLDRTEVPLEGRSLMRLRFRGPRRTFPLLSAADVLAGQFPAERIRGKIAVVGVTAAGIQDSFSTRTDSLLPGVELQATAIDNLVSGDFLHRPPGAQAWEFAIMLAAALAPAIPWARASSRVGALVAISAVAATWGACAAAVSIAGALISPWPASAAAACSFAALSIARYVAHKKRADRTERQLLSTEESARAALLQSECKYQRLVENVNDAITVNDRDGRLVFANRRFREWSGIAKEDLPGVMLEDYVAPEWRASLRQRHDARMRGENTPEHFEFEGLGANAARVWFEAQVANVEQDGQIAGVQSALRDITERKRIEAQYLQAQKMEIVGRLAGGVAHDFNNMLTVINGYSDMLLNQLDKADTSREFLEQIRAAGERAADLTTKLLVFSRKQAARPKPLDLNQVASDAQKMYGRLLGEDIEVIARLSPGLWLVQADPGQMHQVLMNLIVNARDGMPQGGKLTIETSNLELDDGSSAQYPPLKAGSYVYLGVTDTSIGMNDEVKSHLFEPFFTTKEQGKGTGLGLATVYGILRQAAGTIRVWSEPGQGTTFHMYLPRIESGALEPIEPCSTQPPARGEETVLLVEDQEAVREFSRAVLEGYGYRVLQASNGVEAIDIAGRYRQPIQLLLTDVVLPGMSGRALAEKLQAGRPALKVLFASGYAAEVMGDHGVADGAVDYLSKPFSPEHLATRVREVLGA